MLAAVLGLVALTLTAIGIYGVTAQVVRQRAREAAIRVALGAEPRQVVRALVRHGLTWAVAGLADRARRRARRRRACSRACSTVSVRSIRSRSSR